ncbi:hypothetical protein FBEOM_1231 [Fusarium beomiforme]|uniref:Uncharacterized protein n=1 Tax=Fusarium beomiforme TaxID=44412 RepID=A0A9P5E196_9HYPO|nr:hypothetical protein FBEOM_1231 [Fusarium beomiforme]
MKSCILVADLLRAAIASPEADLALEEADIQCVTFLSTYLVAIPSNDEPFTSIANAPNIEEEKTARFPIGPSFGLTFGRNTSIATTASVLRSSQIDDQTLLLPELVSESSTVGIPLSSNELLTSQPEPQASSLDQTTVAASRTTGIVEPEGQTVIFLISLPEDDPERSEDYKELDSQGTPPSDAITKGFASAGTSLTFVNDELPNGKAGFLSQRQNERLVGVHDSSSTALAMTTFQESDIEATITTEQEELASSVLPAESTSSFTDGSKTPSPSSSGIESPSPSEETSATLQLDPTSSQEPLSISDDISIAATSSATEDLTSETSQPVELTTTTDEDLTSLTPLETSSEETTTIAVGDTTEETTSYGTNTNISTTSEDTTSIETPTTADPPTNTVDACVACIASSGGSPPLDDRIEDCEDFNRVTISPYIIKQTILSKRWEYVGIFMLSATGLNSRLQPRTVAPLPRMCWMAQYWPVQHYLPC